MKKRFAALLAGVLLLLSACAPRPAPAASGGGSGAVSAAGSLSGELEPPVVEPSYFGDWEVTALLGTAPACAMSQEELDACVGLTMSYETDRFTAEGLTCEFLPGTAYAEDIVTAETFTAACQLSPEELGVEASMLLHVTVGIQGNLGQNRLLGRDFFVLGTDSLLIYCDGAFFQAERTE